MRRLGLRRLGLRRLGGGLIDVTPLRSSPAFRRLWIGSSLSVFGGQLTLVAVLYQVWELTRSPAWVGAIGLAQAVPMVALAMVGGTLADAVDRRRLVLWTTAGQLLFALLLAGQAVAGFGSLPLVLGLVAALAACSGLGAPARRAFVARLLPAEQVGAGIALNHLSFQAAMLVGPALAGVIIAAGGVAACYLLDVVTFAAAFWGVRRLPPLPPLRSTQSASPSGALERPGPRAIWAGWRFVARRPVLGGAFGSDLLATVLAMPVALFPAVNAERFGGRPETLGLFFSAIAVGGMVAGTASGLVTGARRPGTVMLAAAGVWGAGLLGFGLAQSLWLALGCLAVAGAADTVSVISRGAIVQLATPDEFRGRVSAVEYVIGASGPDVGNLRGGLVAGATSTTFALVSGPLVSLAGLAVLAALDRPLRQFTPTSAGARAHPTDAPTDARTDASAAEPL